MSKVTLTKVRSFRSMNKKNKKLLLVTDIPSPYRVHFFNVLKQQLMTVGVAFEVLFMARTVPIRFWHLDETKFKFTYRIVPGIHRQYKSDVFHFNPGILWSVLKDQPTWLLIGGAWNMPTVMSLLFTRFLHKSNVYTILWSEANYQSMKYKTGLTSRMRQAIGKKADAFAVPGQVAENTIKNCWGITDKPFLFLPNLIDEELYRDKVFFLRSQRRELRNQRNLNDEDLVLLWPARLHEQTKGIINFLQTVIDIYPPNLKILIAGEGPDRGIIGKWLDRHQMKGVYLLGQQSEDQMMELYALSDVLLLPSLRDPNPLSVIEGLWSGLPLFISSSCGNWPEAVIEGKNGWVVDPLSKNSIQEALKDLFSKSHCDLMKYGETSLSVAQNLFSTQKCVRTFVQELIVNCQSKYL